MQPRPQELDNPGVLLINLGSPASTDVADVRAYLNEFLMDPRVLDTPFLLRRLIVSGFILPTRPKKSAAAYDKIWRHDAPDGMGSPLLFYSEQLRAALAKMTGQPVALAMRYGQPSIEQGVESLRAQGVQEVIVAPLYPHYADSTTTTSVEAVAKHIPGDMKAATLPCFYNNPGYINALAQVTRDHLPTDFDHLLMSYHGLPERHLTRTDPTNEHCLANPDCCEQPSAAHATCYRHQTRVTSSLLAQALELEPSQYSVSYQSRLGRLPWLSPYTDARLAELAESGVQHLAVVCPAFVADNLETLEEIALAGRETFVQAGGRTLTLIPCLNDHPAWVHALANLLEQAGES